MLSHEFVKIVNLLTTRAFHKREFCARLQEVHSTYSELLFNNVRWLGQGKILGRFVECIVEIMVFLENKDPANCQLNDHR